MFQFLKRKSTQSPPPTKVRPAKKAQPSYQWSPIITAETVVQLLARMIETGEFRGALTDMPGFTTRIMPDGMEVSTHRENLTGVVLAENVAGISMATVDPGRVAIVALDATFLRLLDWEPDWQISQRADRSVFKSEIPMSEDYALLVECKAEAVDPLFTGSTTEGTNVVLQVKRIQPDPRLH